MCLYSRPLIEQGQARVRREQLKSACIPVQNSKAAENSKFKSRLLDHYKGACVKVEEKNIFYLTLLA